MGSLEKFMEQKKHVNVNLFFNKNDIKFSGVYQGMIHFVRVFSANDRSLFQLINIHCVGLSWRE